MPKKDEQAGPVSVAEALRKKLLEREMTRTELADMLDIRPQNVSEWTRGVVPSSRHTKALARFLGLTVEEYTRLAERSRHRDDDALKELRDAIAEQSKLIRRLVRLLEGQR